MVPATPDCSRVRAVELLREAEIVITEVPDHEQLVRNVLGLPAPVVETEDAEPRASPPSRSARSSSTVASVRTASR